MTPPSGARSRRCPWWTTGPCLTALANDVGFDLVFSRQLIAHAKPGDIALGFSTSGDSVNVLRGLEEGSRRGLLTIGLCGYEGSAMALSEAVTHCLVVRSESVHRIQEAQAALTLRAVVGRAAQSRREGDHVTDTAQTGREAAVFERIEAFRRRRPRLREEVVTLAHGAGGKASAALLAGVFLPAFADDDSSCADRRRRGGRCPPGSGWPSAPTPMSSSRCAFPAAPSAIWPCTAR